MVIRELIIREVSKQSYSRSLINGLFEKSRCKAYREVPIREVKFSKQIKIMGHIECILDTLIESTTGILGKIFTDKKPDTMYSIKNCAECNWKKPTTLHKLWGVSQRNCRSEDLCANVKRTSSCSLPLLASGYS